MKLLITLTLALADANGRLTRYARNSSYSTSHPGRCDRNVFERQFYDLAKGLKPTSDKVTAHSYETRSRTTSPSSTANWRPASSASAIATSRVVVRVSQGTTSRGGAEE